MLGGVVFQPSAGVSRVTIMECTDLFIIPTKERVDRYQ